MKFEFDKKAVILAVVFGILAIISMIAVMPYTEAIFSVFLFWIVMYIIAIKLMRKIAEKMKKEKEF